MLEEVSKAKNDPILLYNLNLKPEGELIRNAVNKHFGLTEAHREAIFATLRRAKRASKKQKFGKKPPTKLDQAVNKWFIPLSQPSVEPKGQ